MKALIEKLRNINNMLIVALTPVIGAAFLVVTGTELSAGAISSIAVMGLTTVILYGVEGAIAQWRKGLNPNVIQPIWQSKRAWIALAGALVTILNDAYPIAYETVIDGNSVSFYEGLTAFIIMALTGISFDDWAEAGGYNITIGVETEAGASDGPVMTTKLTEPTPESANNETNVTITGGDSQRNTVTDGQGGKLPDNYSSGYGDIAQG